MANGTWKIARGKGGAQLPLAIVAVLAIVLVLLGKAQSSVFDRARAQFSDWMAPVLITLHEPVDAVSSWLGSIDTFFVVYQENVRLKEENARLRQWQNAALGLEERIKHYQLLLNAVPDPALSTITAHVIGRASRPFLDTMILDAGKQNGVKPGQAVVDASGMIGRIFLSGDHTAWVVLLTDLNSRIPVKIEPGNVQAILAGDNTHTPALETLALGAKLTAGDRVVTSGDGGLLPPGLPVGNLVKLGGEYRVALLANASTSTDVQIVDYKTLPEEPPAQSANDLPAAAAGLKPETAPSVSEKQDHDIGTVIITPMMTPQTNLGRQALPAPRRTPPPSVPERTGPRLVFPPLVQSPHSAAVPENGTIVRNQTAGGQD
jgi:rod shape-determining protein MreC